LSEKDLIAIHIKEKRSIAKSKDIWKKKGKGCRGGSSTLTPYVSNTLYEHYIKGVLTVT
jgi:hypothetical protein